MASTVRNPARASSSNGNRSKGLLVTALAALTGCDSCERDRPYTPFPVDATATSAPSAPSGAPSAAASVQQQPAVSASASALGSRKLEPPSGRFSVGGRQIELAKEWQAERVLEFPSQEPSQPDALVWVTPTDPERWNGPMGELRWFPLGSDPTRVLELPAFVPTGPGCMQDLRLARLSETTILLDVHARCERSLPQRTPNRAVALLGMNPTPSFLLGLRIAEPAADETFVVSAASADRDGDGREDPSLQFELGVLSTQARANASLGWLDRAAGPSIDEGYFAAALDPKLRSWEQSLKKRAEIPGVRTQTAALRRLLSSLCQQSTVPRVFDWQGEPLRCPSIQQVAIKLARLDVSAALGQGDPLEAAHAAQFAATWLGGLPKSESEGLRRRIAKALKSVKAERIAHGVRAVAPPADGSVRYSPLRFEPEGTLLVQIEPTKLTRIDLQGTATNLDAEADVRPWPLSVTAPNGRRWLQVIPSCDRSELALALNGADGALLPLAPTRLLAPRPGVCRNPTAWPFKVAPIDWQNESPTALIDGACWSGSMAQPCPAPAKLGAYIPGAPRSPDGNRLVANTPIGPVVLGGSKPELWASAEPLDGAWRDCVVANEARAIACINERNDVVLLKRAEATPKR